MKGVFKLSFGDKIKTAREKKKFSQQQLANLLNVTDGTISNYENGVAFPRFETIKIICDLLEVDPNYLFWDDLCDELKDKIIKENNLNKYNSLNSIGQYKTNEYMDDLLKIPAYRKQTQPQREPTYTIAAYGGDENEDTQPPIEEITT